MERHLIDYALWLLDRHYLLTRHTWPPKMASDVRFADDIMRSADNGVVDLIEFLSAPPVTPSWSEFHALTGVCLGLRSVFPDEAIEYFSSMPVPVVSRELRTATLAAYTADDVTLLGPLSDLCEEECVSQDIINQLRQTHSRVKGLWSVAKLLGV